MDPDRSRGADRMKPARSLPITQYVGTADVMPALRSSRSYAYRHLRLAAGRGPGDDGFLRVALETWETYARKTWPSSPALAANTRQPSPGLRLVASNGVELSIRPTQPRTRKRSAGEQ